MINSETINLDAKMTWSIEEASRMSGIGQRKLREIYKKPEADSWRLNIGSRFRIKAEPFMAWLSQVSNI